MDVTRGRVVLDAGRALRYAAGSTVTCGGAGGARMNGLAHDAGSAAAAVIVDRR